MKSRNIGALDRGLLGRRGALGLATAAFGTALLPAQRAAAQAADAGGPAVPIRQLNDALLHAMQQGTRLSFVQRYDMLSPVVDRTFDLQRVLAESIGLSWPKLPDAEKSTLLAAFRRYTVSSYAANFDSFSGQQLVVSPAVRRLGNGDVIVATSIVRANGAPTALNYVMHNGPGGWRAVDVLADGSISRVAVQRSDFRQLLAGGGVPALVAGLRNKVANLSGGMLA